MIAVIFEVEPREGRQGDYLGTAAHLKPLLERADGFISIELFQTSGIVLLAATNQPEVLDPALLRAGRFDRQVLVDRYLMTKEQLEARLAVLMGGRAAEEVVFGHRSTGAADDLARATEMARAMALRYPELGAMAYESDSSPGFLGAGLARRAHAPDTAREVDRAVRQILDGAYGRARGILDLNRDILYDGARALLAKETLDEADLEQLRRRLRPAGGDVVSIA